MAMVDVIALHLMLGLYKVGPIGPINVVGGIILQGSVIASAIGPHWADGGQALVAESEGEHHHNHQH